MNLDLEISKNITGALVSNYQNLDRIRSDPKIAIPYYTMDDEDPERKIKNARIHDELQDHITKNRLILVVFPRGHGKTVQILGRIAYEIGRNPNIRVKIFCEARQSAEERIASIKKYIEENEHYQKLFPHIKPSNTNWRTNSLTIQRKSFAKDPTVSALGAGSAVTGARSDLIICDDVCCENSLRSPAERESIKSIFRNTILNLLTPKGKLIYIATPFHYDDLTMQLMRSYAQYGFAPFIKVIDKQFNPIWKERFSKEALIGIRNSITSGPFSRGYHCEPLADEESTFDIGSIRNSIRICNEPPAMVENVDHNWIKVMGVDPAISQNVRADYTVITVLGIHPTKFYKVPLEIYRGKIDSTETGRKIIELQNKWNCSGIRVESVFYQKSLTQWLKIMSPRPLPFSNVEGAIQKKFARAQELAVQIKNNGFVFYCCQNPLPEFIVSETVGEDSCKCGTCILIKEMAYHPAWKHDDTWDSLQLASSLADEFIRPDNVGAFEVWQFKRR